MVKVFTIFLLFISLDVTAQFVEGQILIYGTDKPLANASIYYDGMYKGGISDEHGIFKLVSAGTTKVPIIISAVGYHSTSIADYTSEEFLKIYLQPKTYALDAVVVTFDGMSREEKEAIFKSEFIGLSNNSSQCEILNLDDINLVYNRKRGTVEAFADDPIILHNKALGFKITYYLEQFKYSAGEIFFAGNYYFEPDTTLTGRDLVRVERKRREAYLGSRMHFIRSLYNDQLRQEGFMIMNLAGKSPDYSGLVVDQENGRSIFMKSRLAIVYKDYSKGLTFLDKNKNFTYIDKNGFYDPTGISWSGAMAGQRMGDLLPFEYVDPRNRKP